jgi:hypothetical protein
VFMSDVRVCIKRVKFKCKNVHLEGKFRKVFGLAVESYSWKISVDYVRFKDYAFRGIMHKSRLCYT